MVQVQVHNIQEGIKFSIRNENNEPIGKNTQFLSESNFKYFISLLRSSLRIDR